MNTSTPLQQKLDEAEKIKYAKGYQQLADSIREPMKRSIDELIKVWLREPGARRLGASIVLGDLGTLPQSALIPEATKAGPDELVDALYIMGEAHLQARDQLADFLKTLLDDKRVLKSEPVAGREETPPSSRICDQAYLFLRRILHPGESRESQISGEAAFLRKADHEKDEIIRAAKEKHEWKALWRKAE